MAENSLSTEARERSQTGYGGMENSVQLKLSIALACACAVAGCAQDVTPIISEPALRPDDKAQNVIPEPTPRPDAKAAIALDCSGLLQGWNQCLLTASNTCGSKGYTILDRSGQNPTQPNESTFTRSMHIHNKAPKTTSLRSNVS